MTRDTPTVDYPRVHVIEDMYLLTYMGYAVADEGHQPCEARVIHLEAGNPKAEIGLVLKILDELNLRAFLSDADQPASGKERRAAPSRLDDVFRRLQRPERK